MRILIANPFGIGDVLFSLPLVQALRELYPRGFLGYVCNRRTRELVEGWPSLDWVLVFEKDEFRTAWRRSKREATQLLWGIVQTVRRQSFDLFLDLSLGWHYGLAAFLAGVSKRVGLDFRGRGRFLTDRIPVRGFHDQPVAEYYLDLLALLGHRRAGTRWPCLELPEDVDAQVAEYLRSLGIPSGSPLVGMVPGGGKSWGPNAAFKQWPPASFAQVADHIAFRHGFKVLLIGGSEEVDLLRAVASQMQARPILALQVPSLPLLGGLLRRCHLIIGNDSGPLHLAVSVGARTVTIFGPVDASVYGPFPAHPRHRVVAKGLVCRPCYREFRFPPCPWENACLRDLPTTAVIEAAEGLLVQSDPTYVPAK